MCEANIVGRDFAKDELEYSSGSDSVVSELLDQKIWTPKSADYSSSINTGTGYLSCSPSDFAIANYAYLLNTYSSMARPAGGNTNVWTPVAASNAYSGPNVTGCMAYVTYNSSVNYTSVENSTTCARPAMLYNLASF